MLKIVCVAGEVDRGLELTEVVGVDEEDGGLLRVNDGLNLDLPPLSLLSTTTFPCYR